jgi:hypothetical protein
MIEEELIKIWQSSPNQERVKFKKARLMIEVQSNIDRMHQQIRNRDLIEQIGAVFVMVAFAYSAIVLPNLLSKVASILAVAYAIFVVVRLRSAKKRKPGVMNEPYVDYLHKMKKYLLYQKHLLDTVLYWYILPGATFTMLFTLGFGIAGGMKPLIRMGVANAVLATATYFLNKKAVKDHLVPRLTKIENLIKVLEEG